MFKDKAFRVRPQEEIIEDLEDARKYYPRVEKIFLCDGDALCLSSSRLLPILDGIKRLFPECKRVGIYASAKDILRKTEDELRQLKKAGLGILYIGGESGSQKVLDLIHKDVTAKELIEAVQRAEGCGLTTSVTFISGITGQEGAGLEEASKLEKVDQLEGMMEKGFTGREGDATRGSANDMAKYVDADEVCDKLPLWQEHAIETGKVISKMNASYVSFLTLMLEPGAELYDAYTKGIFMPMKAEEILGEAYLMIKNACPTKTCVFRSNHASNYVSLKGNLPEDRQMLLKKLEIALENTGLIKDERFRAL